MHIDRANHRDTSKEIALRAYFNDRTKNRLADWHTVMDSLKKINSVERDSLFPSGNGVVASLWAILDAYPNQYWNYPIYVFLHKYGLYGDESGFTLSEDYRAELETLFKECVKYFYIRGLADNAVNTVKDLTFKVCSKIANGEDYITELKSGIKPDDKAKITQLLEISALTRYQRGIVVLSAYLNPRQNKENFASMVNTKYDIEHILPKEWNHYDGWTQDEYSTYLNYLGNLMPLEKVKNIKAQNEYLKKKKKEYVDSVCQDALDMINVPDNGWNPQAVQENHNEKVNRLTKFFGFE
jgi:hypothetical protein